MFGEYLKSSLGVLPWFLLPVACYVLFIMGIDPYYIQYYTVAERVVGFNWGIFAGESAVVSLIVAIVVNVNLLLIIPCAIGGANGEVKHFQFFLGFFTNIAISLVMPLYYKMNFGLDTTTFVILLVLHIFMFLVTFIIGSRFVSPAYKRAFWFTFYG
ncbi:MAG: hypothetical protein LBJ35_06300 [Spirochaetaceae bacterium]|jgi:hypothetical protein|nr:hypothetical protein [Spirochaetaceae bacterium]